MTNEEFEKIWADLKTRDAQREAEFNALPEAERKRLEKEFIDPSLDRFSEDPLGGDDEEDIFQSNSCKFHSKLYLSLAEYSTKSRNYAAHIVVNCFQNCIFVILNTAKTVNIVILDAL